MKKDKILIIIISSMLIAQPVLAIPRYLDGDDIFEWERDYRFFDDTELNYTVDFDAVRLKNITRLSGSVENKLTSGFHPIESHVLSESFILGSNDTERFDISYEENYTWKESYNITVDYELYDGDVIEFIRRGITTDNISVNPHKSAYRVGDDIILSVTSGEENFKFWSVNGVHVSNNPIYTWTVQGGEHTIVGSFTGTYIPSDGLLGDSPSIEIYTIEDLDDVRDDLSERYKLMNDLDFNDPSSYADPNNMDDYITGAGWNPIGFGVGSDSFYGIFDGQNYTISNLYINRPYEDNVGLFGYVDDYSTYIYSLFLEYPDVLGNDRVGAIVGTGRYANYYYLQVLGGTVEGWGVYIGGVMGHMIDGYLEHAYSSSDVSGGSYLGGVLGYVRVDAEAWHIIFEGTVDGDDRVGGCVGMVDSSTVRILQNSGTVKGTNKVGGGIGYATGSLVTNFAGWSISTVEGVEYVGGAIGESNFETYIYWSANWGTVDGDTNVGGLTGDNYDSFIRFSYSFGNVTGVTRVGGLTGRHWRPLVGTGYIENSFSTGAVSGSTSVGGLIGYRLRSTVSDSYWNTQTSGQGSSDGGTGRTTAQMTDWENDYPDAYSGWDFVNYWQVAGWNYDRVNNFGYPALYWQEPVPPSAAFEWDLDYPTWQDDIQFTDLSSVGSGMIDNWTWEFGDGDEAWVQNPIHSYSSDGIYTVTLTVNDTYGSIDSTSSDITIYEPDEPIADFSWLPVSPKPNETVSFTNDSVAGDNPIVNWSWTFGDGNSSYDQNPSHSYLLSGTYTITLTVTDSISFSDSESKSLTVDPFDGPTATFSWLPEDIAIDRDVDFTDESVAGDHTIVNWTWTFGDGNSSYEQDPIHSYCSAGTFTVTLKVTDSHGLSATKNKNLNVLTFLTYNIYTIEDLYSMRDDLTGRYYLRNDLDFENPAHYEDHLTSPSLSEMTTGSGWSPVTIFEGELRGGGYTISNLYINRGGTNTIGLFGYTLGSTIQNLNLVDSYVIGKNHVGPLSGVSDQCSISNIVSNGAEVSGSVISGGLIGYGYTALSMNDCYVYDIDISGNDRVGGLVGFLYTLDENMIIIEDCGVYSGVVSGSLNVGGFVGLMSGESYIYSSFSYADISSLNTDRDSLYFGGFAGRVSSFGRIFRSYSKGNITHTVDPASTKLNQWVGGFVGYTSGTTYIRDSYATGNVLTEAKGVGGFIGERTGGVTIRCWSTGEVTGSSNVGGFGGIGAAGKTDCYWNTETSGIATSAGGTGKNTSQMTDWENVYPDSYANYDFTSNTRWKARWYNSDWDNNTGYPSLYFQTDIPQPPPDTPPTADLSWLPSHVEVNDTVTFSDLSQEGTHSIVNWSWTFGDGNSSYDQNPTHSYPNVGTYSVTLTVKCEGNLEDSESKSVRVYGELGATEHNIFTIEDLHDMSVNTSHTFYLRNDLDFDDSDDYEDHLTSPSLSEMTTGSGWPRFTFTGTFEGHNFTISNLSTNRPTENAIAFFSDLRGYCGNLTLSDVDITGQNSVGALAGRLHVDGTVYNSGVIGGTVEGAEQVGGLIGSGGGTSPESFEVRSSFVIDVTVTSPGSWVGGFMAQILRDDQSIEDSYVSYSNISGANQVGGFIGRAIYANLLKNCSVYNSDVEGTNNVGGFVGQIGDTSWITLSRVVYTSVSGNNHVGGFIGWAETTGISVENYVDYGTITATGEYIGGFIGYMKGVGVRRSFARANTTGDDYVGGFVGSLGSIIDSENSTRDNYAFGNVTSTGMAGGFVGSNFYTSDSYYSRNYAAVGLSGTDLYGFGWKSGSISTAPRYSHCYWNTDIYATNPGLSTLNAVGFDTFEMTDYPNNYPEFDSTYWEANRWMDDQSWQYDNLDNYGYPVLYWQSATTGPIADFEFDPSDPVENDNITFADLSQEGTYSIVNWSWTFGDGNSSYDQNPVHAYPNAGSYTVTLTVTDLYGFSDSESDSVFILLPDGPTAFFSFDPPSPDVEENITFSDLSVAGVNPIINWTWNFGDGNSSYDQDPIHSYSLHGSYNVILNVTDSYGLSSERNENVTVSPPAGPTSDFYYTPLDPVKDELIEFFEDSTAGDYPIANWTWNFGDGTYSYLPNPNTQYSTYGYYNVTLNVTDTYGSYSLVTHQIYVHDKVDDYYLPYSLNFTIEIRNLTGDLVYQNHTTGIVGSNVTYVYVDLPYAWYLDILNSTIDLDFDYFDIYRSGLGMYISDVLSHDNRTFTNTLGNETHDFVDSYQGLNNITAHFEVHNISSEIYIYHENFTEYSIGDELYIDIDEWTTYDIAGAPLRQVTDSRSYEGDRSVIIQSGIPGLYYAHPTDLPVTDDLDSIHRSTYMTWALYTKTESGPQLGEIDIYNTDGQWIFTIAHRYDRLEVYNVSGWNTLSPYSINDVWNVYELNWTGSNYELTTHNDTYTIQDPYNSRSYGIDGRYSFTIGTQRGWNYFDAIQRGLPSDPVECDVTLSLFGYNATSDDYVFLDSLNSTDHLTGSAFNLAINNIYNTYYPSYSSYIVSVSSFPDADITYSINASYYEVGLHSISFTFMLVTPDGEILYMNTCTSLAPGEIWEWYWDVDEYFLEQVKEYGEMYSIIIIEDVSIADEDTWLEVGLEITYTIQVPNPGWFVGWGLANFNLIYLVIAFICAMLVGKYTRSVLATFFVFIAILGVGVTFGHVNLYFVVIPVLGWLSVMTARVYIHQAGDESG